MSGELLSVTDDTQVTGWRSLDIFPSSSFLPFLQVTKKSNKRILTHYAGGENLVILGIGWHHRYLTFIMVTFRKSSSSGISENGVEIMNSGTGQETRNDAL